MYEEDAVTLSVLRVLLQLPDVPCDLSHPVPDLCEPQHTEAKQFTVRSKVTGRMELY